MRLRQIPIETMQAGLYKWKMTSFNTSVSGYVVVRGPNAGPIGQWSYPQDSETWYWGNATSYSGNPSFSLTLQLMRSPNDGTLIRAIDKIRTNQTEVGTASMVPSWQSGAPLPESPQVVTLTEVLNGPGQYGDLYENVSFLMPVDGSPLMPTWYTSIEGLYSVFGGDPQNGAPIQEGIEAKMTYAQSGQSGFPNPNSWYWCGRDPS